MEIKYTIEILTKDIQDIEKLVGKLQNSQDGSAIELDLALSKLRNVYEILTLIKADRLHEMIFPHKSAEPVQAITPEPAIEEVTEKVKAKVTEGDADSKEKKAAGILAEKFSAESSINENLAGKRGKEMDSKIIGQHIENIGRNIGINDRFLIIRELFGGNTEKFSELVKNLEEAGNFQNAFILLQEQFTGSMDHEGVEILSGLLKRRYSQH